MLVLSRKPTERIQIGDSIVVTVVRVDGNTVRLGIEAPHDVRVYRHELLDKGSAFHSTEGLMASSQIGILPKSV